MNTTYSAPTDAEIEAAFKKLLGVVDGSGVFMAANVASAELVGNTDEEALLRRRYEALRSVRFKLQSLKGEVLKALEIPANSADASASAEEVIDSHTDEAQSARRIESAGPSLDEQITLFIGEVQAETVKPPTVFKTSRGRKSGASVEVQLISTEDYTPISGYRPYLLRAMGLMGGQGKFPEIVNNAFSMMKREGAAKKYDDGRVGSSTNLRRYQSQCAAARKQLIKAGVIEPYSAEGERGFRLTDAGRKEIHAMGRKIRVAPRKDHKAQPYLLTDSSAEQPEKPKRGRPKRSVAA